MIPHLDCSPLQRVIRATTSDVPCARAVLALFHLRACEQLHARAVSPALQALLQNFNDRVTREWDHFDHLTRPDRDWQTAFYAYRCRPQDRGTLDALSRTYVLTSLTGAIRETQFDDLAAYRFLISHELLVASTYFINNPLVSVPQAHARIRRLHTLAWEQAHS